MQYCIVSYARYNPNIEEDYFCFTFWGKPTLGQAYRNRCGYIDIWDTLI